MLEFIEHIQASAAPVAFDFVSGIGDELQLIQDETGDNQRGVKELGLGDIRDPAVNNHGCVQYQRSQASCLPRKLDIRNQESEVIFGSDHDTDT